LQSKNKLLKIFLLVLTIVLFILYFVNNRDSFARIGELSVLQFLLIFLGQTIILVANALTLMIIVSFCRKKMDVADAARVTAYSSLINFFGFLQGGVGFRAVYLKKIYEIPLKKYFALTAVQYILLFGLSGLLLFFGIVLTTGLQNALLFVLMGTAALLIVLLVMKKFGVLTKLASRFEGISFAFGSNKLVLLIGSLLLQLCGSLIAYGVALQAIGANITAGGLMVFTGISQFSVVIALTPGALGIREGLLLIVQDQMLLTTSDIIVASTIDRVVYFMTLVLLVPIALSMRKKIGSTKP
jgi:uncharacterized membrane protein YbhN (UPF0104 family)